MANPKITIISPSIRPTMLAVTFQTLQEQTFQDFEWIPRLSIPRGHSDLCAVMNEALNLANGEIIVFLQDSIKLPKDALQRISDNTDVGAKVGTTYPVSKTIDWDKTREDWRTYWKGGAVDYQRFEIDFGSIPRHAIGDLRFNEQYDNGFGWENVEFAFELENRNGVTFRVDPTIQAIAFDHDATMVHPWKGKPNRDLWLSRKPVLELMYDKDSGDRALEPT